MSRRPSDRQRPHARRRAALGRRRPAPGRLLALAAACVLASLGAAVGGPGAARAAASAGPTPPSLQLRAGALYVPATGQFLYADHARERRAIASTTKMMTALVTLQHVKDLNTVFTYPDYHQAADDSQIGLRPGERMTVRDLLIAMMLPSADDAAEDLAYNVGHHSVARFIGWMNADARALGLTGTHYSTPIGLDTPGNYSTAADLVRLAQYDLSHQPFFARVVRMAHATLRTGPAPTVTNLNLLVGEYRWVIGVKTGHTNDAGYVLVAAGQRHGLRLVDAVLGTPSETARDAEALALLDWGYANFRMFTPLHARQAVARLPVKDRPGLRVPVRATRGFRRVLARSSAVRTVVEVPRRLVGPLPAGTVVGHVLVRDGTRTLARVPVVLERRLKAVPRLVLIGRFFLGRPWLIGLIAFVALGAIAALWWRALGGGRGGRGLGRGRRHGRAHEEPLRTESGWEGA
ncbi:MAG TPA: D-alanyl-D-alanine carboxypeptidase family protein [Solirubrobacteraceae bacterium]|nr:D-alanyl-D-alanine carboxypeptidase family protein [Solirubrobacteraceae bacterium]